MLSLIATIAIVVAVSIEEDGDNGWGRIGVWAGAAIAAALATFAPSMRTSLNMDERRAWVVAAIGGVFLVAFWVLLVLPAIQQNTSFLATVGCAAGAAAAWLAPGRPEPAAEDGRW